MQEYYISQPVLQKQTNKQKIKQLTNRSQMQKTFGHYYPN